MPHAVAVGRTSKSNRRVHRHRAIQCSPGLSPSSMLHTKATGRASIVVGSPSMGTTPRKIDLVRGSFARSLTICWVSILVVADDVPVLVDFQHGFELGVLDDVHGLRQRVVEMHLDTQVAFLYQMETRATRVGGQVETEEGVAVPEVGTSQNVSFVLPHLTGRREQVEVTPDEEIVAEIRLERFTGYLSSVDVHGEEVDGVVLGAERVLRVRTVVRIVVDAAQHQTFRQGTEEQVLVRVQVGTCGYGIDLAIDGMHRILDRALLQGPDVHHMYGRIHGGFPRE